MIPKAKVKFIKSLQIKKYRKQEQCFLVEGAKSVQELVASDFEVVMVAGTQEFLSGLALGGGIEVFEATENELSSVGEFQTNNAAVAIARMKPERPVTFRPDEFVLLLDDIRDPGNLGTIIRTADWYGIQTILASSETADVYSAKVITATMGSFTRVNIFYTDLLPIVQKTTGRVFGALLEGKNVHQTDFGKGGLIVIGNESRGISTDIEKFVTDRITIPRYGHAESLNAAIATAIICDNVRRNQP